MSSPLKSKIDALFAKAETIVLSKQEGEHRVVEELHNLSGQFFAGTLLRSLLITLRDALLLFAVLTVVVVLEDLFLCGNEYLGSCTTKGSATHLTAIFLITVAGVSGYLSYLCSKQVKERRFQHSALMSAFSLIFILTTLFLLNASWLVIIAGGVLAFLAMFRGYRAAVTSTSSIS